MPETNDPGNAPTYTQTEADSSVQSRESEVDTLIWANWGIGNKIAAGIEEVRRVTNLRLIVKAGALKSDI